MRRILPTRRILPGTQKTSLRTAITKQKRQKERRRGAVPFWYKSLREVTKESRNPPLTSDAALHIISYTAAAGRFLGQQRQEKQKSGETMEFETISPREIDAFLFQEGVCVIDIREPREFRRLHLKGAVCIPYEQLEERARFLKNQTLVLYCERGGTSLKAARELGGKGYRVKTMIGGIQAYKGRNLESYLDQR